ncbi:MAG: NUDIX domain-containing protein, partial [Candidatus Vogelbacteria bacterium]|nr:NUDIX domain-containing protein [Candidatus Vogelbacteria bacterium]
MRKPIRAVAIVIKDKSVLLMHRINQGKEYYVFPGGGVEENETVKGALVRELHEETSIEVKNLRLLYHHHIIGDFTDSDQYFYLCDFVSGVPKLSEGNELEENRAGTDFYEPLWYPISKLPQTLLYPLEIRDWLSE